MAKNTGLIYLDHNATTPCLAEVISSMQPFFSDNFANPSSPHQGGRNAAQALDKSRESIASFLNASPEEIIFNSGGTEGNNHAILKTLESSGKNEIITSSIEHSSVLSVCKNLQAKNIKINYLPCNPDGIIDLNALANFANQNTALITVMLANNETGAIQPIKELANFAKQNNIPFHCDAVQGAGKIKIDVRKLGVDMLSISAHKFYGPKGVGALFVRRGFRLPPILYGGSQENRKRAGTENLPAIVGAAKAAEIASKNLEKFQKHCSKLRNILIFELSNIEDIRINTPVEKSVSNTLNISFKDVSAEALVTRLDMRGICVSNASACAGLTKFSHVLKAMSVPDEYLYSSVRISLGWENTEEDIIKTAKIINETVCEIRKLKQIH